MSFYMPSNKTLLLQFCKDHKITSNLSLKVEELKSLITKYIEDTNIFDINIISDTTDKIKTIYHMSDIHIRPLDRHEEYTKIFNKLIDNIISDKSSTKEEKIIIIVGDILHSKEKLTSESIMFARKTFSLLSNHVHKVIVTSGNHDMIENNKNRLDNIIPITANLPNVHYIKDTSISQINNLLIYNNSLVDNKFIRNKINPPNPDQKYIHIALYHGMLSSARLYNNTIITQENFTNIKSLTDFSSFDITLLGDIHKRQLLYNTKHVLKAVYPGSLIQQNFGESIANHGYIKWNINNTDTSTSITDFNEIDIPNETGYINVIVQNNLSQNQIESKFLFSIKNNEDISHIKYPHLRYHLYNISEIEIQPYIKEFESKQKFIQILSTDFRYHDTLSLPTSTLNQENNNLQPNPISFSLSEENIQKIYDDTTIFKSELNKFKNNNTQLDSPITTEDIESIIKYHSYLKEQIKEKEKENITINYWKILSLKFRNTLIYGSNRQNIIDFKSHQGTISITGSNAIGKSAIIKIIMFILFSSTSYGTTRSNMINYYATSKEPLNIELEFIYGDTIYKISKTAKLINRKNTRDTNITTNFEKYNNQSNQWESLNEQDSRYTSKLIEKILGSDENFTFTNIYSYNFMGTVIHMSEKDRLKKLTEFFKLNWYESLEKIAKEELKEETLNSKYIQGKIAVLKEQQQQQHNEEKSDTNTIITEENIQIKENEIISKMNKIEEKLKKYYKQEYTKSASASSSTSFTSLTDAKEFIDSTEFEYDETYEKELLEQQYMLSGKIIPFSATYSSSKQTLKEIKKLKSTINLEEEFNTLKEINKEIGKLEEINFELKMNTPKSIDTDNDNNISTTLNLLSSQQQTFSDKIKKLKSKYIQIIEYPESIFDNTQEFDNSTTSLKDFIKKNKDLDDEELIKSITYSFINKYNTKYQIAINKIQKYSTEITNIEYKKNKINIIQNEEKILLLKNIQRIYELKEEYKIQKQNEEYQDNLNSIKSQLSQYIKYKEALSIIANEKISNLTSKLNILKEDYKNIISQKIKIQNIISNQKEIENNSASIINIQNLQRIKQIYLKFISKNGIPMLMLEDKLKLIEEQVNKFLEDFTTFKISMKITEHPTTNQNQLIIKVIKKETEMSIHDLSGYETFITNIAIKAILFKHSYNSKCSLLCIDEGLDCIDQVNFTKLKDLMKKLKEYYTTIIIISHIKDIHNIADYELKIERFGENNKFSYITFNEE